MDCTKIQEYLSDFGESGMTGLTVIRDHLENCSSCRAELAIFDQLKGALASLAGEPIQPPSWLEGTLTETIAEKANRIAAFRRVEAQVRRPQVVTGGALVAAGIAGALLVRSRRRRRVGWTGTLRQAFASS